MQEARQVFLCETALPRVGGEDRSGDGSGEGERQCWICLEQGGPGLIAPCQCLDSGMPRWVHRECLNRWRVTGRNARAFTHCPNCGFAYLMVLRRAPTESEQHYRERRRRFLRHTAMHFLLFAATLQFALCLLAMLIRLADPKEELVVLFNLPQRPSAPPAGQGSFQDMLAFHKSTYYLAAILTSLFLVGVTVSALGLWRFIARWTGRHQVSGPPGSCCDHCEVCANCAPRDVYAQYFCCNGCGDCVQCCGDCCECCCENRCEGCERCECSSLRSCVGGLGDVGEGCATVVVGMVIVAVLLFIFVGLFFALAALVTWAQKKVQSYYQLQELRQLTGEYEVQDLALLRRPVSVPAPSAPPLASAPAQDAGMGSIGEAAAPSAPPLLREDLESGEVSWAPVTDGRTQRSLAIDLQAVYGYSSV
mmetsp:Transcript_72392/g.154942  ORF Transcript_72392/g.154942 Transcript_72392/m.154942 type:complete len:421 (-) Transcript_72392:158-1420(-)